MKLTTKLQNILAPAQDYFEGMLSGFAIMMPALLLTILITVSACNKDFNDRGFPPPQQTEQTIETVSQYFGMQIGTESTQMTGKSWNITTWTPEYSPTAVNLTVTGTGSSFGTNYTKTVTVAELKQGITFDMLAGTYKVTYETIHKQASGYSMNSYSITQLTTPQNKTVGQYLDIKIDQDVTITGSPLNLQATLTDALVVVDINGVTSAERQAYHTQEGICSLFLNTKFATDGIYYGYVDAQPLYVYLYCPTYSGGGTMVDLTTAVNGRAYHLVKPFNAQVVLDIQGLTSENVIVP
jgi:hypothetical protein